MFTRQYLADLTKLLPDLVNIVAEYWGHNFRLKRNLYLRGINEQFYRYSTTASLDRKGNLLLANQIGFTLARINLKTGEEIGFKIEASTTIDLTSEYILFVRDNILHHCHYQITEDEFLQTEISSFKSGDDNVNIFNAKWFVLDSNNEPWGVVHPRVDGSLRVTVRRFSPPSPSVEMEVGRSDEVIIEDMSSHICSLAVNEKTIYTASLTKLVLTDRMTKKWKSSRNFRCKAEEVKLKVDDLYLYVGLQFPSLTHPRIEICNLNGQVISTVTIPESDGRLMCLGKHAKNSMKSFYILDERNMLSEYEGETLI